jgi:Zn-dependent protease
MNASFRLGRIAGIEVRVHISLFIILVILSVALFHNPYPMGFDEIPYPDNIRAVLSIVASVSLFVAVLIHELSHSIVSMRYGVVVRGITLFIFGGVAMLENIPKEPRKEIAIAVAGPLASIAIAVISFGIYFFKIPVASEFFRVFGNFNAFLAAFNLIPAFPLDGGRILRGILATRTNFIRATHVAAEIGKTFAIFMGVIGIFTNPWLILIALFIYIGANEEEKMTLIENALKRIRIGEIMTPNPVTVTPETTVGEIIELMFKYKHLGYPVVEDGKLVGIVTLDDVAKAPRDAHVAEVMSRNIITINPENSAFDAFKIMNEYNVGRLPVVEGMESWWE